MPFISVTRLRIRTWRFLPHFLITTTRAIRQVRAAPGFQAGALLNDRAWTFWTLTAWDSQAAMRTYMTDGAHRTAMPRLLDWADEASVVHWEHPGYALPDWPEADRRMREAGRPSKLRHPGPLHAALAYAAPRLTRHVPIRRVDG